MEFAKKLPELKCLSCFKVFLVLMSFCFIQFQNPGIVEINNLILLANDNYTKSKDTAQGIIEEAAKKLSKLPIENAETAELYHQIGKFYYTNPKDSKKALLFFEKALIIRQNHLDSLHKDILRNYLMIGSCQTNIGYHSDAIKNLEKALFIYKKGQFNTPSYLSLIYNNLGLSQGYIGQISEANNSLQQALLLYKPDFIDVDKAELFKRLGINCYRAKDYIKSNEWYKQSIDINLKLGKVAYAADCLINQSINYRELYKPDSALLYIQEANQKYQQIPSKSHEDSLKIAIINIELAHCYKGLNNSNLARKYYNQAVTLLKPFKNENYQYHAEAYRGVAAMEMDKTKQLAYYHQAVSILIPEFDPASPLASPPSVYQGILTPIDALEALSDKAAVLYNLARQFPDRPNYFIAANAHYRFLDQLIINLNSTYKEDGSKINLLDKTLSIYEKALSLAKQANDTVTALYYFDRNKALILREALLDRSAKQFAGMPQAILEKEQTLEIDIVYWRKKATDVTDSSHQAYQDSLFSAKDRLQHFIDSELKQQPEYAKYYDLKYKKSPPLSIPALQARLKDSMALIEYFLGEDSLYTFVLSKTQSHFLSTPLPQHFLDTFSYFRQTFISDKLKNKTYTQQEADFCHLSHYFYKLLLAHPLSIVNKKGDIRRLRFVPDGVLGYLPFSLLLDKPDTNWQPDNSYQPAFITQRYATSYAYSRDLLLNSSTVQSQQDPRFGVFGISYDDFTLQFTSKNGSLSKLDNAKEEAKTLKSQIGGDAYTDDDISKTTKKSFLDNMKRYSILHLSMHASLDEQNPLNSALIFSKRDSKDDNLLTAGEVYAYQLNHNDLTVLSACNTGNGKLHRGEGIMSLSRALTYAGCKSLVANLWSVNAVSASKLMPKFYEYLQQGMDKDIALQEAQKWYLRDNKSLPIPNQWAFSIVTGDIDAIPFKKQNNWWLWLLMALGSILGLWFYKRRK